MEPSGRATRTAARDDQDHLGPAIERGLDADVRRREGQHFTSADVADLISAFCIRSATDHVLDPACGTGSLLLRARARLAHLAGEAESGLPSRLVGVESDPRLAAAARRNLPGAELLRADFLTLDTGRLQREGLFDAVIGNPPYVRQELLPATRKRALARPGLVPFAVSRRSDLHVYFWPKALALLHEGGRLGLLTSNTWLDAEYGGPLRRWLAASFTIVAVVESETESWFDDARVRTVITILEKRRPETGPPARLARLRRRLDEMVPRDLRRGERLDRFAALARGIEAGDPPEARVRAHRLTSGEELGAPWGPALRMPDLYYEILSRAASRLVPLEEVASVSWGIKTGDDALFLPRAGHLPEVEPRFLVPAVFSLMELDRVIVTHDQIRRRLLLVDLAREGAGWRRRAPRLARHLDRAERDGASHLRPTCAARERAGPSPRRWFELRPGPPAQILWSIMHQYRHLAPFNPEGYPSNDNLLGIRARAGVEPRLLAALLNSHVQALIKLAHGRHRNEGMLKMQTGDLRRMPVPDPRLFAPGLSARLIAAFNAIADRAVGRIPDECARPDRRALDLACLAAIGYAGGEGTAIRDRLYESLIESCRRERIWEIDAVARRRAGSIRTEAPA